MSDKYWTLEFALIPDEPFFGFSEYIQMLEAMEQGEAILENWGKEE